MTIPTMETIKTASEQTGLSYDYLRKLCLQGKIVYVRAGSKYLINMEKLVDFLNRGALTVGGLYAHLSRAGKGFWRVLELVSKLDVESE